MFIGQIGISNLLISKKMKKDSGFAVFKSVYSVQKHTNPLKILQLNYLPKIDMGCFTRLLFKGN